MIFADIPLTVQRLPEKKQKLRKAYEKSRGSASKLNESSKTVSACAGELHLTCSQGLPAPVQPGCVALPASLDSPMQPCCTANLLLSHPSADAVHEWDFFPVRLPQNKMVLLHVYDTL